MSRPHLNGTARPPKPAVEEDGLEELPPGARALFVRGRELGVAEQDIRAAQTRLEKKKKKQPAGEAAHETV